MSRCNSNLKLKEKTKTEIPKFNTKYIKQEQDIKNFRKLRKCKTLSNHNINHKINGIPELNKLELNSLKRSKTNVNLFYSNRYINIIQNPCSKTVECCPKRNQAIKEYA
jgi:hypothetical protein